MASAVFYSAVCWGGVSTERGRKRLTKLVMRASSVLDCPLDSIEQVGERRMLAKLTTVKDSTFHPLHETVVDLSSSFSSSRRRSDTAGSSFQQQSAHNVTLLFFLLLTWISNYIAQHILSTTYYLLIFIKHTYECRTFLNLLSAISRVISCLLFAQSNVCAIVFILIYTLFFETWLSLLFHSTYKYWKRLKTN